LGKTVLYLLIFLATIYKSIEKLENTETPIKNNPHISKIVRDIFSDISSS